MVPTYIVGIVFQAFGNCNILEQKQKVMREAGIETDEFVCNSSVVLALHRAIIIALAVIIAHYVV